MLRLPDWIDGKTLIDNVVFSSAAEKAGIVAGDVITAINGADLRGKDHSLAINALRGEVGSDVDISSHTAAMKASSSGWQLQPGSSVTSLPSPPLMRSAPDPPETASAPAPSFGCPGYSSRASSFP